MARKAAHLEAKYGAVRPGRPGSPIALAAGERRAIGVTMFKGAAISGVLRDPTGSPLTGMPVVAVDVSGSPTVAGLFQTEIFTTDDRGAYRIYGLMPGDYVVIATPTHQGSGVLGAMPAGDMETVLANLARRQNQGGIAGTTPVPIESPTRRVNFAPIYFPGTSFYADAARIRLQPGEERDGASFEVSYVPVASIEGTIMGDVTNLASTELSIVIPGPRLSQVPTMRGITSKPPNERGEFLGPQRVARALPHRRARAPASLGRGSTGAGAGANGRRKRGISRRIRPIGGTATGVYWRAAVCRRGGRCSRPRRGARHPAIAAGWHARGESRIRRRVGAAPSRPQRFSYRPQSDRRHVHGVCCRHARRNSPDLAATGESRYRRHVPHRRRGSGIGTALVSRCPSISGRPGACDRPWSTDGIFWTR